MKQLFRVQDTVTNKISYYLLAAFVVALPFDLFYSEIILVGFALHTLIHMRATSWKNIFSRPFLILVSVYLLGLVAILYSPDKKAAIGEAGKQSAILVLPLLFSLTDIDLEKYRLNFFCLFALACSFAVLYLYGAALINIREDHLPAASLFTPAFMNHKFAMPLAIHATYLAAYCAFAAAVFLYLLFTGNSTVLSWLYSIGLLIVFAGLLQLSSRAVFIAFLIILNIAFPLLLFKGKKRLAFFAAASLLSIISLAIIFSVDAFKERYISNLKTDLTNEVKIIEDTEPRASRWTAIMELIKESPVIGYGNGSETMLLKEKFYEKGYYVSYLNEFNSHNQYLSILIRMGIVGLAFYCYALYIGFARALQYKDVLFLSFMILMVIVFCSENFLDLNKGIFFYSFFFSVFLLPGTVAGLAHRQPLLQKIRFKL